MFYCRISHNIPLTIVVGSNSLLVLYWLVSPEQIVVFESVLLQTVALPIAYFQMRYCAYVLVFESHDRIGRHQRIFGQIDVGASTYGALISTHQTHSICYPRGCPRLVSFRMKDFMCLFVDILSI